MAETERLTIVLPVETAAAVRNAVDAGHFDSISDVVQSALHEWAMRHDPSIDGLSALKADLAMGLADVSAGRVKDFDAARIVELGRRRSAGPARSD